MGRYARVKLAAAPVSQARAVARDFKLATVRTRSSVGAAAAHRVAHSLAHIYVCQAMLRLHMIRILRLRSASEI